MTLARCAACKDVTNETIQPAQAHSHVDESTANASPERAQFWQVRETPNYQGHTRQYLDNAILRRSGPPWCANGFMASLERSMPNEETRGRACTHVASRNKGGANPVTEQGGNLETFKWESGPGLARFLAFEFP